MAKAFMVVEVDYDPTITDAEVVSNALDVLLDTAKGTPGILDEVGNPRVAGFYPIDPEDIQHLHDISKRLLGQPQRDALANILHRLGVLKFPQL